MLFDHHTHTIPMLLKDLAVSIIYDRYQGRWMKPVIQSGVGLQRVQRFPGLINAGKPSLSAGVNISYSPNISYIKAHPVDYIFNK